MTTCRLLLTNRARKDVDRLSPTLRHQIATALERITQNPLMGKALKGEFQGLHSYRMGTHRIIYQIHAREILVIVLKVGHRREVYRQR
ncbi:MAG: type II toxin-antitoxin system RelE/ParE family toxin [Candidatus Omnitrophica bacterium]|nr:type II toxin-antitoxin system RelE/ParE family toxin [Candidatus Omnitrophota bacterium]